MGRREPGEFSFFRNLLFVLFVMAVVTLPASAKELERGKKVKSISGVTLGGEKVVIEFEKGNPPAILTFWSMYCRSCMEELEKLQALVEKYSPDKVRVYAINEDSDMLKKRVEKFLGEFSERLGGFKFKVLYDEEGKIFKSLSLLHLPTLIYLDGDGTVREIIEGFEAGRQRAVISALTILLREVSPEKLRVVEEEKYYEVRVEVPVCGVYLDDKWVRPVDDSREERDDSLNRSMELADEMALREVVKRALNDIGIKLYERKKDLSCVKPYGIDHHLRAGDDDGYDEFIRDWDLRDVLALEDVTKIDRGRFVEGYYQYRVNLRQLQQKIVDSGYTLRPVTFILKYVNPSLYSHRVFSRALPTSIPLVSSINHIMKNGQVVEDEIVCYTSDPDLLVERLEGVRMERERVTAEFLGGNMVEIQFWR